MKHHVVKFSDGTYPSTSTWGSATKGGNPIEKARVFASIGAAKISAGSDEYRARHGISVFPLMQEIPTDTLKAELIRRENSIKPLDTQSEDHPAG